MHRQEPPAWPQTPLHPAPHPHRPLPTRQSPRTAGNACPAPPPPAPHLHQPPFSDTLATPDQMITAAGPGPRRHQAAPAPDRPRNRTGPGPAPPRPSLRTRGVPRHRPVLIRPPAAASPRHCTAAPRTGKPSGNPAPSGTAVLCHAGVTAWPAAAMLRTGRSLSLGRAEAPSEGLGMSSGHGHAQIFTPAHAPPAARSCLLSHARTRGRPLLAPVCPAAPVRRSSCGSGPVRNAGPRASSGTDHGPCADAAEKRPGRRPAFRS